MSPDRVSSTSPELLRQIVLLSANSAWNEFFHRYEGFIRAHFSIYGLDPDTRDELCQRVWVELVRRMPAYQYDPGRSFRGWLRRLCRHR